MRVAESTEGDVGQRMVDVGDAKTQLSELVQQPARGEDVILTSEGKPVARLVPISSAPDRREFGSAKGLIKIGDDFDAPLDGFP